MIRQKLIEWTLAAAAALSTLAASECRGGPLLDWLFHCDRDTVTAEMPVVCCDPCDPCCDPCGGGLAAGPCQEFVGQVNPFLLQAPTGAGTPTSPYRSRYLPTPVTYYRPVTGVDPATGAVTTYYTPCSGTELRLDRRRTLFGWLCERFHGSQPAAAAPFACDPCAGMACPTVECGTANCGGLVLGGDSGCSGCSAAPYAAPGLTPYDAAPATPYAAPLGPNLPFAPPASSSPMPAAPAPLAPVPADQAPSLSPGELRPGPAESGTFLPLETAPAPGGSAAFALPPEESERPRLRPLPVQPLPDLDAAEPAPVRTREAPLLLPREKTAAAPKWPHGLIRWASAVEELPAEPTHRESAPAETLELELRGPELSAPRSVAVPSSAPHSAEAPVLLLLAPARAADVEWDNAGWRTVGN